MARQTGAVGKFVVKWLVVPIGLAALGFFVIGPRIGTAVTRAQEKAVEDASPDVVVDETGEPKKFHSEPKVTVDATPVTRRSERRRSQPAPERDEPEITVPPVTDPEPSPEPESPAPSEPNPDGGTTGGDGG